MPRRTAPGDARGGLALLGVLPTVLVRGFEGGFTLGAT